MPFQRLLFLYAAAQALLYCSLLPLWEGYDEPFHYAYVQYLIRHGEPPVLDRSRVSLEVWESMRLAPASHLVVRNAPALTSYADFARLPKAERDAREERLDSIPRELREIEQGPDNYEAQQPPLAYVAMAPLDWALAPVAMPYRIWALRLFAAALSLAAILWAVFALGREAGIREEYVSAAAFVLVSTQNLYGAVAHVASDWLAVAMIPVLALAAARLWRHGGLGNTALTAFALSAGLLGKSYFLAFVPFSLLVAARAGRKPALLFCAILAATAAPWYYRNWTLYGSLTGLQSATRSVDLDAVWRSFLNTGWLATIPGMLRGFLWTGNSSFTTFSSFTLNLVLVAVLAGWALRVRGIRSNPLTAAEVSMTAGIGIFAPVLVYALALFRALSPVPVPNVIAWYAAGLLPAAMLMAFSGFSRQAAGRWIARALLALAVYIVAATYFVKLIPMYAGYEGRLRLAELAALYGGGFEELRRRLDYATPVDSRFVMILAVAVAGLALAICLRLGRRLA